MQKQKETVEFLEYKGGFVPVSSATLVRVMEGYREGVLKKDHLRVFAAQCELRGLHKKSKVDIFRVLNCKASLKGVKRLRSGVIRKCEEELRSWLSPVTENPSRSKAVSRRVLRAIAQGRVTATETMVLFMYALKRISQVRELKRLLPKERYARFTFGELSELTGIAKANISRSVKELKVKSFIASVWVVKPNENQFGLLFVDGQILTLIQGGHVDRSKAPVKKITTPQVQKNNAPVINLPTLKKDDPKIRIQKENNPPGLPFKKWPVKGQGSFSSEWERIQAKARAIEEALIEQVA